MNGRQGSNVGLCGLVAARKEEGVRKSTMVSDLRKLNST